ncbi:O-antigen ligase [Salinibacterium sp. M195]|uniref:O-antigen ligase family protein n=1 Tax=Salinibacterium sp. M195 TaxID=2583374 RepID=UPI002105CD86|nr:O-antigen ligase family protein [Salinibacterium sp. M195]QYH35618.1 O-antigen ligase family protein [Salinibacterium sp. M195]
MIHPPPRYRVVIDTSVAILGSPRVSAALSTATIATALCTFALRHTIGTAGLLAILGCLVVLVAASLAAQWGNIGWRALVPISLIAFTAWAWLTVFWSQYQWASLASLTYLLVFTVLGIYIALVRDTIQIVRAFGDVMRFVLVTSMSLEILTGLIFDTSLRALSIAGNLGTVNPIQGIFGARNQLGIIAVIALITFATELRTKSLQRGYAIGSIVLAALVLVLSQSPLAFGTALIVLAASAALYGLRRVPSGRRRYWQFVLIGFVAAVAVVSWLSRTAIVASFDASGDLSYRLRVWRQLWSLGEVHRLEGWGWIGPWKADLAPFTAFGNFGARVPGSAHNAYLDVWFQLGLVGFLIFIGLLGLAFMRSWLLASRRRSVVFAWPALVLLVLIVSATAESSLLIEFGWLTFVVCCVKAARELSWRNALDAHPSSGI